MDRPDTDRSDTLMPDLPPDLPAHYVKAYFSIDATSAADTFEGWYNPDWDWNGFAAPHFTRAEAERVIAWVTASYATTSDDPYTTFAWEGDTLIQTDRDDSSTDTWTERYDGQYGLYPIGGGSWTWFSVDIPAGANVDHFIRARHDESRVAALVHNILNQRRIDAKRPLVLDPVEPEVDAALAIFAAFRPEDDPDAALPAATVDALGYDSTGRFREGDTHPTQRFPYTWGNLTDDERELLMQLAASLALSAKD